MSERLKKELELLQRYNPQVEWHEHGDWLTVLLEKTWLFAGLYFFNQVTQFRMVCDIKRHWITHSIVII